MRRNVKMFCEKERKIPRSPPYASVQARPVCSCAGAAGQQRRFASEKAQGKRQKTALRVCLTAESFCIGRYARAAPLNVSVTLVPSPGSLSSLREAPCSSAPCLTMDRPSPVPPTARANGFYPRGRSARRRGSMVRVARMPMPVSSTTTVALPPASVSDRLRTSPPLRL